jgi:hypothetical protein
MSRVKKSWRLPVPFDDEDFEWLPVVRVGRIIPFGYLQDPTDRDILLPIPEELELLEKAKKHLGQYSYREVAAWLSTASSRYISHVGLMKRVELEQKRKKSASNQRRLAEKYQEAIKKAERFESQRIGGKDLKGIKSSSGIESGVEPL